MTRIELPADTNTSPLAGLQAMPEEPLGSNVAFSRIAFVSSDMIQTVALSVIMVFPVMLDPVKKIAPLAES